MKTSKFLKRVSIYLLLTGVSFTLLNNRTGKTLARAGAQPFTALKVDIEKLLTAE